ncbi:MAG: Soluble lytic murein transglycosylase precursor [Syntrophaceae bacterium PtaU1.Bin231]|nr:MAG: Soluble lytic murein transglycosylase precursor [Syntrophaceae bacterium PtaU1.Bin231]
MIRALSCTGYQEQRAAGNRWLPVAALCFFIALSMHAHRNDGAGFTEEPSEAVAEAAVQTRPAQPDYFDVVRDASVKHDLDPKLIASMIHVESGWNEAAVSPKGAKGLMQLTPAVYRQYGIEDPFDIEQNIHAGAAYMAHLLARFNGNLALALAAYNCGPTRVTGHNGLPPIKETRDYVKRVLKLYREGATPADVPRRRS